MSETEFAGNEYNDLDEEDILFQCIPLQCNQNSSANGSVPLARVFGMTQLHQNYMHQTLLFHQPIQSNKKIFSDIMLLKKLSETNQQDYDGTRVVSINLNEFPNRFNYQIHMVRSCKDKLDVASNCEWLDNRLDVDQVLNDQSASLDQLIDYLRMNLVNVSNDLMIYYHTKSEFILQITRLECFNLLMLLKDPRLDMVITNLQDGFSQFLLRIITQENALEDNGRRINITIPLLVENIINNYVVLEPRKPSMKIRFRNIPKVVFYSCFFPASIVMQDDHINPILDKKIISLQRRFYCKVVLEGPITRCYYASVKGEFYRLEILFDYQFNYWILVKNDLIQWFDSFTRSSAKCYIDKACVSFVTKNFFCCDEIQNLMKRQHLLREVDTNFAKIIKWSRINQVEKSVL